MRATPPITRAAITSLVLVAACSTEEARDQPPAPISLRDPVLTRFHMQRRFDSLREVERELLDGKLDAAKERARALTIPSTDPGLAAFDLESKAVTRAAEELAAAPSIDEALRREARVGIACAECHFRAQKPPTFAIASLVPDDRNTEASRMARHAWATDRLWEGLVAGDDQHWWQGLVVLAQTHPPKRTLAADLGELVRARAREAMDRRLRNTETLDERGRLYGEMLVACAGCHEKLRR